MTIQLLSLTSDCPSSGKILLGVGGIVLVAGMSQRMGEFKPLMKIGHKTMIETTVDHMLEAGVSNVVVVIGCRGDEVCQVLQQEQWRKERLTFIANLRYNTTQMLDSIQLGLPALESCERFFVVPGDMPAISATTYRIVYQNALKSDKGIVFPRINGYRKHPPLISTRYIEDILHFRGAGLREFWRQYEKDILEVDLNDQGCMMDADYKMDYTEICRYLGK